MKVQKRNPRLGRRGKVLVSLTAVAGTLALLLYFEQIALIYILSSLALVVLLILVAFSDLESIGVRAAEEAYMTGKSEGVFEKDETMPSPYDNKRAA